MNTRTTIAIGGLLAAVVAFGVGLGVVFATDDEAGDGFMGMMEAMGDGDPDGFAGHMRKAHGEDGVGRMLDHMRDHGASGPMTGDPAIDDMTHPMMDGMMEDMQADKDGLMPGHPDTHHQTPTPRRTPGP